MPAYLNDGATSLAAGSWTDGIGFAANADLVIGASRSRIITALNQSASAINSLHILRGAPRIDGANILEIAYAASPTAEYPLVIDTDGGVMAVQVDTSTNDLPAALFAGTTINVLDGEITSGTVVVLSGSVTFGENVTWGASAKLLVKGGVVTLRTNAALPNLIVSDRGSVATDDTVVTSLLMAGGTVSLRNTTGNGATSAKVYGGVLRALAGNIPTLETLGAPHVDIMHAERALSIGATAYTHYAVTPPLESTSLVTVAAPVTGVGALWGLAGSP